MAHYPASLRRLIQHIAKLPGIGEKTAERLANHLLKVPRREAERLAHSILEAVGSVRFCSACFALSDGDLCDLCKDPTRNQELLCVVEKQADMVVIEKSGAFNGRYHILQGVLAPLDGVGPDKIRFAELMARVAGGTVREVVLATGTSVEGEATAAFIAERLGAYPLKVTRIASGVPVGGDLKYVDQVTMKRAMESRHGV
jgi:recombination protein RecR